MGWEVIVRPLHNNDNVPAETSSIETLPDILTPAQSGMPVSMWPLIVSLHASLKLSHVYALNTAALIFKSKKIANLKSKISVKRNEGECWVRGDCHNSLV